ncbi:hypothetical protein fHeYen901_281 [Yersinia phage fHe-Yen9-01]|uniref:Uncharacterized protein n=1 Tax=Yersinia phage fHe-Yen9-01 TaxID=1965363 RepID=A0A1V0DY18_9CAUD|nr:hypothetical protein KNT60_gp280 [Yersinia phage fHe-Yen9-01]ARB06054.1 hypothetical protein fHeYen901_281 [Yersinia phage fHe-Yen9-01]
MKLLKILMIAVWSLVFFVSLNNPTMSMTVTVFALVSSLLFIKSLFRKTK